MERSIVLTDEQQDAIRYCDGPEIIIAGAGTGKTTVIVEKIVHLVDNLGFSPENILAITFTNKAADELLLRVKERLGEIASHAKISTFHSFCLSTLDDYTGINEKIPPRDTFLDDPAERIIVDDLINRYGLVQLYEHAGFREKLRDIVNALKQAKDELAMPEDYIREAEIEAGKLTAEANLLGKNKTERERKSKNEKQARIHQEMAKLYVLFLKEGFEKEFYDQSDLHRFLITILADDAMYLEEVRTKYKFILVDEFQDVNYSQIRLCELLAKESGNICMVGDDDQAIYRFRGSSHESFKIIREIFQSCKTFTLNINFRSNLRVLAAANALITGNRNVRLEPERKLVGRDEAEQGERIRIRLSPNETTQARILVEDILERANQLYPNEERPFTHFAVLYRTHSSVKEAIQEFKRHNIPYEVVGGKELFRSSVVMAIWSVLRMLKDDEDETVFYRALHGPAWKVPLADIYKITNFRRSHYEPNNKRKYSFLNLLMNYLEVPELSAEGTEELERVKAGLAELSRNAQTSSPPELVRLAIQKTGVIRHAANQHDSEGESWIKDLVDFINLAEAYNQVKPENTILQFLDYLEFTQDSRIDTQGARASLTGVSLLTVHAAKGLEFDQVYLVGFHDGNFPERDRTNPFTMPKSLWKNKVLPDDSNVFEERRLFFVAMTRAKYGLTLCGIDNTIFPQQDKGKKKTSRFLIELREADPCGDFVDWQNWGGENLEERIRDLLYEGKEIYIDRAWRKIYEILNSTWELPPETDLGEIAVNLAGEIAESVFSFLMLKALDRQEGSISEQQRSELAAKLGIPSQRAEELYRSLPRPDQLLALPQSEYQTLHFGPSLMLSYTSLNAYDKCPFRFQLRNLLRLSSGKSDSRIYGSFVHKVLSEFGAIFKKTNIRPDIMAWQNLVKQEFRNETFPRSVGKLKASGEMLKNLDGVYKYLTDKGWTEPPLETEAEINLDVREDLSFNFPLDIKIKGYIDWVQPVGNDIAILDFKTGPSGLGSKQDIRAGNDLQLGVYALAAVKNWPEYKLIQASYLVLGKQDSDVDEITCENITELRQFALQKIGDCIEGILARSFDPKEGDCFFCDIKDLCPLEG